MDVKKLEDQINSNDDIFLAIDDYLRYLCERADEDPDDYEFVIVVRKKD